MTNQQKNRLWNLSLLFVGAGAVLAFILTSLNQQMLFFVTPSQWNEQMNHKRIRLGGIVKQGTVKRLEEGLAIQFTITDHKADQEVYYRGFVPDLFKEGQGVIAEGKKEETGIFIANQILAKHDENYMPKAVYQQLRQSQKEE